jgi:ParB family chromosome partitioning protein
MKEEKIESVKISDLKIIDNSRAVFNKEDLSSLMESIRDNGLIQPIVVRKSDMAVICGNRRLVAHKKLGLTHIKAILREDSINDNELIIENITENLERKNISSAEIGRICKDMINGKFGTKMTKNEIAVKLKISLSRVNACLKIFESIPKKYRHLVTYCDNSNSKKNINKLPESLVVAISSFNRTFRKLNEKEMEKLIKTSIEKGFSSNDIHKIGLLTQKYSSLDKALSLIDTYIEKQIRIMAKKEELIKAFDKEKATGFTDFVNKVFQRAYPDLL